MNRLHFFPGILVLTLALTFLASCEDDCTKCVTGAVCGNLVVESSYGEECDLGSANSDLPGAACRTNCTKRDCGDGIVDPGEECDDGQANSNTLADACRQLDNPDYVDWYNTPDMPRFLCRQAFCGDGVLDTGEECDDGNVVEDDDCSNTCLLID